MSLDTLMQKHPWPWKALPGEEEDVVVFDGTGAVVISGDDLPFYRAITDAVNIASFSITTRPTRPRVQRDIRRAIKDAISAIEILGDDTERDPVMNQCMRTLERLRRLRDKLEQKP